MKKIIGILLTLMLIFSLAACVKTNNNIEDDANATENNEMQENEINFSKFKSKSFLEMLKNTNDEPLITYLVEDIGRESMVYNIYVFKNGKVSVYDGGERTLGEYSKMLDNEIIKEISKDKENKVQNSIKCWEDCNKKYIEKFHKKPLDLQNLASIKVDLQMDFYCYANTDKTGNRLISETFIIPKWPHYIMYHIFDKWTYGSFDDYTLKTGYEWRLDDLDDVSKQITIPSSRTISGEVYNSKYYGFDVGDEKWVFRTPNIYSLNITISDELSCKHFDFVDPDNEELNKVRHEITENVVFNKDSFETTEVGYIDIHEEDYVFAMKKGDYAMQTAINELLSDLKNNGDLDSIVSSHYDQKSNFKFENPLTKENCLVVSVDNVDFAPFVYRVGNGYSGIDIEIAKRLADKLGKELFVNSTDWEHVLDSVINEEADIAMSGITNNGLRMRDFTLSDIYYSNVVSLLISTKQSVLSKCHTIDDVEKMANSALYKINIGCQKDAWWYDYCANEIKDILEYDDSSLAIQDLLNGKLDAVIIDKQKAITIVAEAKE